MESSTTSTVLNDIVNKLHEIGGLKFGDFTMKSGQQSPVYVDLRVIISHPKLLESIGLMMWEVMESKMLQCNSICGVPYNALPIATVIAVKQNIPMLIRRKEAKLYGTKKLIEGDVKTGDSCLIIEDVVTTGSSILETVTDLQKVGLEVKDAIVLVNREQGAKALLAEKGIKLHSLFTMLEMVQMLKESGKIGQDELDKVKAYLKDNQTLPKPKIGARLSMKFEKRADSASCPVASALLRLMAEKKSNLCVAADVHTTSELLTLARLVGPYVCLLKTHADMIANFTQKVADELKKLAQDLNFMILEDRKFADIGSTVVEQYKGGSLEIIRWADLVTAHALPGEGMLQGLQKAANELSGTPRGCFLLAEMSCAGNLITADYANGAVTIAKNCPKMVAGLVCQSPLVDDCPGLVQLTPGVRLGVSTDGLGQQWVSPEEAVLHRGGDVIVVGRGITAAKDVASEAKVYQQQLWSAYEKRTAL